MDGDIVMDEIILITDYNDNFLISLDEDNNYVSMDLGVLSKCFEERGVKLNIVKFDELKLETTDYNGRYVLYQSSEQVGQLYKKYIEDIVYHLEASGAIVLPKYNYLKAHHNKGFMELLRSSFKDQSLKTIKSRYFGTSAEAIKYKPNFPVVIKQISGAGSKGVYLAKEKKEYEKAVKKASNVILGYDNIHLLKNYVKRVLKKFMNGTQDDSKLNVVDIERPIIVQNFINDLSGDYKVLYFGGKFYTLYRENRDNDFRASGGGKLKEVPMEKNYPLLDFALKVTKEIDFPIIGMDIGYDGVNYHLIEFQMIHLGPYTLLRSSYYFEYNDEKWERIDETSELNDEFARSICEYIKINE